MFTTLNAGSLEQLHVNSPTEYANKRISPVTGKPKRHRSRMGCYYCRARKRKCDEKRPSCTFCSLRDLDCQYPQDENNKNKKNCKTLPLDSDKECLPNGDNNALEIIKSTTSDNAQLSPSIKSEYTLSVLEILQSLIRLPKVEELDENGDPIQSHLNISEVLPGFLIEPTDTFRLYMDERSMNFVSYFHKEVVNFVSITPLTIQNHLANTYMSVAVQDQSFLALLATWGALFLDGPESESYKAHLNQAHKIARQKLEAGLLSDMDKFIVLCFYAGIAGVGICAGNTSDWYELLRMSLRIMSEFGSVRNFLERFHYLNEAKCIVANLQYHEVMSSISMKNGTLLKMSDYSAVFEDDTDFSYGVDPLQGCIHPVFTLLGEIINAKAEHLLAANEIEEELKGITGTSPKENEQFELLTHKRLTHYFRANSTASLLMAKVDACVPKQNQQCFLSPKELDEHLILFEAFRNTCKLNILVYIQGMRFKAPEVQLILVDTFKLIDLLIKCRLRSAISMVLLMCGLCSCYPGDRAHIKKQFEELQSYYNVHNVKKIQTLVEHSWVINPHGDVTVHWEELCEQFGWILAAS